MKTRWLIYILLGVFLSSCYKEENIEGEEDEPKYKVEDSEDPLDHFIYGFYHDYGVFILGNYIHLYSITLVKGCKRILY